jgi:methyl-accepting chemotaxis protein
MKYIVNVFLCFFLAASTWCVVQVGNAAHGVQQDVHQLATPWTDTGTKVNARLDQLDPVLQGVAAAVEQHRLAAEQLKGVATTLNKEVPGVVRNTNAVLVQAGIAGDQLAQASIEQRDNLKKADAAVEEFHAAMANLAKLLGEPAWHETAVNTAAGTKSAKDGMEEVRQAIYEMRHPPKRTRGGRIIDFILRNILGNAVQGAVRR